MADTLDDAAVADRLRDLPAWSRHGDEIRREVKARLAAARIAADDLEAACILMAEARQCEARRAVYAMLTTRPEARR